MRHFLSIDFYGGRPGLWYTEIMDTTKTIAIAHEGWLGPDIIEATESTVDAEIETLADHWDTQGADTTVLRSAEWDGSGAWYLSDGSVIARDVRVFPDAFGRR